MVRQCVKLSRDPPPPRQIAWRNSKTIPSPDLQTNSSIGLSFGWRITLVLNTFCFARTHAPATAPSAVEFSRPQEEESAAGRLLQRCSHGAYLAVGILVPDARVKRNKKKTRKGTCSLVGSASPSLPRYEYIKEWSNEKA